MTETSVERTRDRFDALLIAWQEVGAQPFRLVYLGLWDFVVGFFKFEPDKWPFIVGTQAAFTGVAVGMFGWGGLLVASAPWATLGVVVAVSMTLMNVLTMFTGPLHD